MCPRAHVIYVHSGGGCKYGCWRKGRPLLLEMFGNDSEVAPLPPSGPVLTLTHTAPAHMPPTQITGVSRMHVSYYTEMYMAHAHVIQSHT